MKYEWQARSMKFSQPPLFDVSLSWTGVSGTTASTAADPAEFSATLETNMTIDDNMLTAASSYNCTITFRFAQPVSFWEQYAVNPLSYTCQLNPVLGRCLSPIPGAAIIGGTKGHVPPPTFWLRGRKGNVHPTDCPFSKIFWT